MGFEGQKEGFAPLKLEKVSGEYSNVALEKADVVIPPTRFPTENGNLDRELGQGSHTFFSENGSVEIT